MNTRFSQRPAPRKRPWICKRSPPCLDPEAIPDSLLATFFFKSTSPPTPGQVAAGTIRLDRALPSKTYTAAWTQPPNRVDLSFTWFPDPYEGIVAAVIQVGTYNDYVDFPRIPIIRFPTIRYEHGNNTATFHTWATRMLITG